MATSNDDAIKFASGSGFPLQIAVQHAVQSTISETGWKVQFAEHGWTSEDEEANGFIDLVLRSSDGRWQLVVECKRHRDTAWVFMHSDGTVRDRRHAKSFVSDVRNTIPYRLGWDDVQVDPPCPEVTFCAIRGQNGSEKNAHLDRIASELVLATESVAKANLEFREPKQRTVRIYVPVVVTTAELKITEFQPGSVSLNDGELIGAEVKDVPWLRLRKQLGTGFQMLTQEMFAQRVDPAYMFERTVFVVRASALVQFLKLISIEDPQGPNE